MAKPIIGKMSPLNALQDVVITFSYAGNLSYKNRLIVREANSLDSIYDNTVVTMQLRHTIPAGTMTNGRQYTVEVICYDINDVPSEVSNRVFFWCLDPPVFEFEIEDDTTIENSSVQANIDYSQDDEDDLVQIQYYLYDFNKVELMRSDIFFDPEEPSYTYKGLENQKTYYIRALGQSRLGVQMDTGYVKVNILYKEPETYARLYTESDKDGIVSYHTNLVIIEPDRPSTDYEYDNGFINLEGDSLVYSSQFIVPGDFTMCIKHLFPESNPPVTLLKCENNTSGFKLEIIDCTESEYRYKLTVPNSLCNYILYSELFFGDADVTMVCWIRRINDVYQLRCYQEDNSMHDYNLFIGETKPTSSMGVTDYDVWIDLDGATSRVAKDDVVVWYQDAEPTDAVLHNIWIGEE